jgi:hypothetical protein
MEVANPFAMPQVLDGDLTGEVHDGAAFRAGWVVRVLDRPGKFTADAVEILPAGSCLNAGRRFRTGRR